MVEVDTAVQLLSVMGAVAVLAAAGGAVMALARKWELARALGRWAVFAALLPVPFAIALLVTTFGAVADAEASSKATLLAKSISGTMNAVAPGVPSLLVGVVVWVIASQRLQQRRPAPQAEES
jgi:hypothetical protein